MQHLSLTEALDLYLLEDRAESTKETYRKILKRAIAFFGPDRDVDLVTKEDVLRYISHLRAQKTRYANHSRRKEIKGGLSPKTIEKHVKTLSAWFNWMVYNEYLEKAPTEKLRLKRSHRPAGSSKAATPEELRKILKVAEAKAELGKPRHLAIFLFLADTGCRAGEAANLTINNLLLESKGAWVIGKGDKLRPVFFGDRTAEALRAWLAVHPEPTPDASVFGMTSEAISQVIYRMAKTAGIKRSIKAHAIRHRVGQVWGCAQLGEQATQLKLGHDNPGITIEMYYNTTWQHVKETSERMALASIYGLPTEPTLLDAPLPLPIRRSTAS